MKEEHAIEIVKWCHRNGIRAKLYKGYSGKFMFGETTTGVVVSKTQHVACAIESLNGSSGAAVSLYEEMLKEFDVELPYQIEKIPIDFKIDTMALYYICY